MLRAMNGALLVGMLVGVACTAITGAEKFVIKDKSFTSTYTSSSGAVGGEGSGGGSGSAVSCHDDATPQNACSFATDLWNSCCAPNCGPLSCSEATCSTTEDKSAIVQCVACPQTCQGFFDCMSAISCVSIEW